MRFVTKYSLVFQRQLLEVQQILLGASITVCKKKIRTRTNKFKTEQ